MCDVPANTTKQRLGSVIMERDKDMMDLLTSGQGVFHSRYPMSMEDMGQVNNKKIRQFGVAHEV